MRNRIVTYATLLAGEARAAGINGCFGDVDARRRFEAASFRSALRRLRPKRRSASAVEAGDAPGAAVEPAKDGTPS